MRPRFPSWPSLLLFLLIGILVGLWVVPRSGFWSGVFGNIIAAILLLPGFWLLNFLEVRCNQIRTFFGIRPNSTFFIFVGHLPHQHTQLGLAGVEELNEAHELRSNLQSSIPGLGDVYLLRRLKLVDVEIRVIVADTSHGYSEYLSTSFVTVGSGDSNGVSKQIEPHLPAGIDYPAGKIRISGRELEWADRGLIVCRRHDANNVWFYLAGQMERDTAASVRYLRVNWNLLFQSYPKGDFYYLLDTSRQTPTLPLAVPSVIEHAKFP
jgi:hypothetical protein